MASFLPVCATVDAAVASYVEHGGAVIRMPALSPEYDAALNELYEWCDEVDAYMMRHPEYTMGRSNRSTVCGEAGLRFSVNHWNNMNHPAWQSMLGTICSFNAVVNQVLERVVQGEYHVNKCGGDFVHPGALTGQDVHADGHGPGGWDERPRDKSEEFCNWAVCSLAVHEVTVEQAPLLFYGWDAMRHHCNPTPPKRGEDLSVPPTDCRVPMQRGDIFLRNPKVWHAGSGNCTDQIRYLPGIVFERSDYK